MIAIIINFCAMLICGIATISNICENNRGMATFSFILLLINLVCFMIDMLKFFVVI